MTMTTMMLGGRCNSWAVDAMQPPVPVWLASAMLQRMQQREQQIALAADALRAGWGGRLLLPLSSWSPSISVLRWDADGHG